MLNYFNLVIHDLKTYSESLFAHWELKTLLFFPVSFLVNRSGISKTLAEILFLVMLLDLLLGLYHAYTKGIFSCRKLKRGISKFVLWIVYILLMSACDLVVFHFFAFDGEKFYLASIVTASIIFTEIASIIKHCLKLKFPVPEAVIIITNSANLFAKDHLLNIFKNRKKD